MSEIASSFITVATIDEFSSIKKKSLMINGSKILLLHIDDRYYAIDDTCTHDKQSLSEGLVDGWEI
jgi:nitrite reductase/ring-hydroxylating ferredoxin subunit